MAKEVVYNQEINKVLTDNIEIFKYEYSEIDEKKWNDFKSKPNCKCRGEILKALQSDQKKLNSIFSKLMEREMEIFFPTVLEKAIVKEFKNIKEMEDFLTLQKNRGVVMRSASPSPNGKGGFILILM